MTEENKGKPMTIELPQTVINAKSHMVGNEPVKMNRAQRRRMEREARKNKNAI